MIDFNRFVLSVEMINTAELMVLHSFEDGSGVAVTPEGYFTASNSGEKHLRVTVGLRSESLGKYRARFARFARPD